MNKSQFLLLVLALSSMVFLSSCNDNNEPADPADSIKGSTWQLNGELMPTQGIQNLRVTFDNNLDATNVSFSLDGTSESYSGGDVSGSAVVSGENVEFDIEFGPNEAGFDGTLNSDRTSGTGIVSHRIRKDLGGTFTFLIGTDLDGTITKQ